MNPVRDVVRLFAVLAALCTLAPAVSSAAEVGGTVFDDRNADGEFNSPEPGVVGWVVYIDADADGVLDNPSGAGTCTAQATERCVITDAGGAFRFTGLSAGAVQVRIVPQPDWPLTTDGAVDLVLASDDTVIGGVIFGVFRLGIATGTVFVDADGDGFRELAELPLPGTTVFVDADLDDVFDTGELSANSGEDGTYAVDGLTLGTHELLVRNRCGFIQTLPPPPTLRWGLTVTKSGQVIDGRDVGLQPPAILPGDGNGDGVITAADLVAVAQALGTFPGVYGTDANQDGGVHAADLPATVTNIFDCAGIAVPVGVQMATATATATSTATVSATSAGASPTASATAPLPTATATVLATATATMVATATGNAATPTATPTATTVVAQFCDTVPGPIAIPDDDANGLNRTIVVQSAQTIADLNVSLSIAHTRVGDLRVVLTHLETGKSIFLLDGPGRPATVTGCGLDNVDAVFDDASLRPVEDRCAAGPPLAAAIDGSVAPNEALSIFNGDSLNGTWRLNLADLATEDVGSLLGWCLVPNSPNPVVRDFTCGDGETECVVGIDSPFQLSFSYADPNGDAAMWHITARRGDGIEFEAGNGPLPLGSAGTVTLDFSEFTCPTQNCPDTNVDYFITITDSAGHESPPQRLRVVVTLIGL